MNYSFFAMISRMKYIDRWALMRNTDRESLDSHSKEVAVIAHALAVIGNKRFGKAYNPDRAAVLGLYHDAHEIITGDMPTPVKYHSEKMESAYQEVENMASEKLLSMLPDDMREYYSSAFFRKEEDEYLWKLVKAADKISALIKCIEEKKAGNSEFSKALESTLSSIEEMELPEADEFMKEFIPSFYLSLDELNE